MTNEPSYWVSADLSTLEQIRAFDAMPLAQRGVPANVYTLLGDACRVQPDKVAIHFFTDGARCGDTGQAVTYRELWQRINQSANLLHSLGVGADDVVALLVPAVPEALYTLWGAQAAGVVQPINWMLEPAIIAQLIRAAGAKVLVAYAVEPGTDIWEKVVAVVSMVPELEAVVRIGDGEPTALRPLPGGVRLVQYAEVIDRFAGDHLAFSRDIRGEDTAALFHTGGTTGAPKLARHTHAAQVFAVWSAVIVYNVAADDVRCCGLPLFHVTGALLACLLPVARGSSVVLMTSSGWRHPSVIPNFWKIVDTYGITAVMLVPTVVAQLLAVPLGGAQLDSLRAVSSGAAPLSTHVADAFENLTGLKIREGYGMTETTAVTVVNPRDGVTKIGSVGLPLPYQHFRVVRLDGVGDRATDCRTGEAGLLLVRGPAVFPGYLDEAANQGLWVEDGWLNTGDLAYLDEEGYLWITGRAKDLIIRGGHNIDPRMVEESLYAHPGVIEAAVVGAPDARAGEVPVAYIALKAGAVISSEQMLAYAAQAIPERAAVPKACYVVPALPKTSIGKLQKNILRADAAERVLAAALQEAAIPGIRSVRVEDRSATGLLCSIEVDTLWIRDDAYCHSIQQALGPFTVRCALTATTAEDSNVALTL